MVKKAIIDTDLGIDDAMALLFALKSPELAIAAITTVYGNVPVDIATRNVFTTFSLVSVIKPPLVAKGADRPRQKRPSFATNIHGDDGLGNIFTFDDEFTNELYNPLVSTLSERNAVDEILYHISTSSHPITLITIGPLTNIATAIEKDKKIMSRIKQLIIMGGAIEEAGNITPAAEFNIYCDPEAARIVLNSGLPITMVGLDVTQKTRISKKVVQEIIASYPNDNITRFLYRCTSNIFDLTERMERRSSIPLHDPLAVGVAINSCFF